MAQTAQQYGKRAETNRRWASPTRSACHLVYGSCLHTEHCIDLPKMMTLCHGNAFCDADPFRGDPTGKFSALKGHYFLCFPFIMTSSNANIFCVSHWQCWFNIQNIECCSITYITSATLSVEIWIQYFDDFFLGIIHKDFESLEYICGLMQNVFRVLFTNMDYVESQHGLVTTCPLIYGSKLLICS